jgi:peptidyl-prolyl cis-trans isomerase C
MIKYRPAFTLIMAAGLAGMLTSACDQTEPVAGNDAGVVATVNGVAITELDMTLASSSTGGHEGGITPPGREEMLQQLILQELAHQKAVAANLQTDSAYQQNLRRVEAQIAAFKRKALANLYYERELANRSQISDEEARSFYEENAEAIAAEIRVWQIMRRDEDLIEQDFVALENGESFEQVAARRFADMPQVVETPWDMGYLKWEQVPEAWWDAVDELNVGDTSNVIRGPNSRFWIIRLVDKRDDPNVSYENVQAKIKAMLKNRRTQQFREDMNAELLREARVEYAK